MTHRRGFDMSVLHIHIYPIEKIIPCLNRILKNMFWVLSTNELTHVWVIGLLETDIRKEKKISPG